MEYIELDCEWLIYANTLSDAEFGRLIRAGLLFAETREEVELVGNERHLFPFLKMRIDEYAR